MRLSLVELKRSAKKMINDWQYLPAVRIHVAILRRQPEDFETRLDLADALARLGARGPAVAVYRAVAQLCLAGGRPLVALVAMRSARAQGGEVAELERTLAQLYGRGSSRLADKGGRLNVAGAEFSVDARELRKACSVEQLVAEATRVGSEIATVDALPPRFNRVPILSELDPATLERLVRSAGLVVHRLPAGQVVMRQGEPGRSCFLVARGKLRVVARNRAGEAEELATLADGAVVGEMALVSGEPRAASVQTVAETELIELGPAALRELGAELAQVTASLDQLARRRMVANVTRSHPLFASFTPAERRQILRRCEVLELQPGTILFAQGESSRGVYLVLRGSVAMSSHPRDIGRVPPRAGPGGTLGSDSMLLDTPSHYTATTTVPSTILYMPGRHFRRLTGAFPAVARAMGAPAREVSHAG